VEKDVFAVRHVAVDYLLANFFEFLLLPVGGVPAPLRKIQVFSSFLNVVRYQPRYGSDVAVPRP
jgi:hypothetical protein